MMHIKVVHINNSKNRSMNIRTYQYGRFVELFDKYNKGCNP